MSDRVRMRSGLILGAAALLVAALLWLARPIARPVEGVLHSPEVISQITKDRAVTPGKSIEISRARIAGETAGDVVFVPDIFELARKLNHPDTNEEEDIAIVQELLAFYRRSNNGSNPDGGLNYSIVQELRGRNKKQLAVLPEDLPAINQDGELVDRWGSPYFFHPVSDQFMEIRSAGPDRTFWTRDDVQPWTVSGEITER